MVITDMKNSSNMNNDVQFFVSLLSMEACLKDGYVLSINRTWDRAYLINVVELAKCRTFDEDPFILQQRSPFCFLEKEANLQHELDRLWRRLVKENLIKSECLAKNT